MPRKFKLLNSVPSYKRLGTTVLYNAKAWNIGTNPDLAFASLGPYSCLLDRCVLEKFPVSWS